MSKPFKDITGQKFGRLTALYRLHNYHKNGTYWLCICECGNLTDVNNDNLTIDRINVNGNYEPSNCRWVDRKTQQRNRRNCKYYNVKGKTHCLKEWCDILNLNYNTVQARLKYGWTIEKALFTITEK